jgi:acyl-CoA thioester hydrolase
MRSMDGFRLVVPMRARFRDTDAMGHVNNAIYFTYFEEARAAYFREVTNLRSYNDVAIILAHTRCDFRSPLYTGEEFDVGVRVDRIGRKSFDMSYRAVERGDERVLAEGTSVQVAFDYAAHASVAVPEEFRTKVQAFEGQSLDGAG